MSPERPVARHFFADSQNVRKCQEGVPVHATVRRGPGNITPPRPRFRAPATRSRASSTAGRAADVSTNCTRGQPRSFGDATISPPPVLRCSRARRAPARRPLSAIKLWWRARGRAGLRCARGGAPSEVEGRFFERRETPMAARGAQARLGRRRSRVELTVARSMHDWRPALARTVDLCGQHEGTSGCSGSLAWPNSRRRLARP